MGEQKLDYSPFQFMPVIVGVQSVNEYSACIRTVRVGVRL